MKKVVAILFFSQSLFNTALFAQYDYKIRNWTVKEGLAQGSVHKMLRDSVGFLWIATDNGLNRFDGAVFKQYANALGKDAKGFKGSETLGIIEDSLHNLWIGTEEGLNRFVRELDSFQHIPIHRSDPNMASYSMPLVATSKEVIAWEITGNIVAYNIHSLQRQVLFTNIAWPATSYYLLNNSAYDKTTETIWTTCETQICWFQLNKKTNGIIELQEDDVKCNAILTYNSGLLLATTKGLLYYSINDQQFEIPAWSNALRGIKITTLSLAGRGDLWMGTEKSGVYLYIQAENRLINYRKNVIKTNSISSDNVYHLYCDRDDIVWASTGDEAIDQILPFQRPIIFYNQEIPNSLNNFSVRCFAEDINKDIWIGTLGGGINVFDPEQNTFRYITKTNTPGIRSNFIQSIRFNSDCSNIWIGTDNGLVLMNTVSYSCTNILFTDEYDKKIDAPVFVHQAISFDERTLAIATTKGAFLLEENSTVAKIIPVIKNNVFFIAKFENKYSFSLWDYDPVLYSYNQGKWVKENFPFDDMTVGCIFYDQSKKIFWVGTDRGLFMTDTLFNRLRHFTIADGLPDNFIWGILIDSFGDLWVSTNRGIGWYNTKADKIHSFSPHNDTHGFEYSPYAYLNASDRSIYLGGKKGFDHIFPQRLQYTQPHSSVYFSELTVNNKPFDNNDLYDSVLHLRLKHNQNNVALQAGAIDFFSSGLTKIRYKLFPAEKEWQESTAPYQIRYSGLSPGSYVLSIMAADKNSTWDGPVKQIHIDIDEPFWQRIWFLAIAWVLALVTIVWLIQKRINAIRKREREKIESIKRMAELELQSLRAQLNPHFMFNSLNAIQELILMEENEKSQAYLARFAKLLRLLLENADKPLIPLQREIDFLKFYLSLENLRISDLQFSIEIDKAIDTEKTMIPNMILQPYIENAIWHGLSHKEKDKQLRIRINQENGTTKYEIEDNGVGRKRSTELRSVYRKEHKSKGMELLSKRFKLLSKEYGSEIEISVDDITSNGNIAGTLVTIRVPSTISLNN